MKTEVQRLIKECKKTNLSHSFCILKCIKKYFSTAAGSNIFVSTGRLIRLASAEKGPFLN